MNMRSPEKDSKMNSQPIGQDLLETKYPYLQVWALNNLEKGLGKVVISFENKHGSMKNMKKFMEFGIMNAKRNYYKLSMENNLEIKVQRKTINQLKMTWKELK